MSSSAASTSQVFTPACKFSVGQTVLVDNFDSALAWVNLTANEYMHQICKDGLQIKIMGSPAEPKSVGCDWLRQYLPAIVYIADHTPIYGPDSYDLPNHGWYYHQSWLRPLDSAGCAECRGTGWFLAFNHYHRCKAGCPPTTPKPGL